MLQVGLRASRTLRHANAQRLPRTRRRASAGTTGALGLRGANLNTLSAIVAALLSGTELTVIAPSYSLLAEEALCLLQETQRVLGDHTRGYDASRAANRLRQPAGFQVPLIQSFHRSLKRLLERGDAALALRAPALEQVIRMQGLTWRDDFQSDTILRPVHDVLRLARLQTLRPTLTYQPAAPGANASPPLATLAWNPGKHHALVLQAWYPTLVLTWLQHRALVLVAERARPVDLDDSCLRTFPTTSLAHGQGDNRSTASAVNEEQP